MTNEEAFTTVQTMFDAVVSVGLIKKMEDAAKMYEATEHIRKALKLPKKTEQNGQSNKPNAAQGN
jgi:hypothetical protein